MRHPPCLAPILVLAPSLALGANVPAPAGNVKLELGQSLSTLPVDKILQMGGALALVLFLIAALAWIVRRYGRAGRGSQGELALLGGLTLGGRERLMLVRAGRDRVLFLILYDGMFLVGPLDVD